MHPLLKRQLKRVGADDLTAPPSPEKWVKLLEGISNAYTESDQGRALLERSLALSSKEMQQLYDNLRETSELRLKDMEKQTQNLIDHALDGIISINAEGKILTWNPQATEIFGWTYEQVIGKDLVELIIPPHNHETYREGLKQFAETRSGLTTDQRLELLAQHQEGHEFPIELSIIPIIKGDTYFFYGLVRDITQRKLVEETMLKAKEAAEHAAKAKSEFLATMSHEIRTPMNGIIGMTGLLMDTNLSAQQHQFAETVRHSGEALLTIINDILDFSKIEAGKLDFETIDFDLRVAMEDTLDLLAEKAGTANLELIGRVETHVPTALRGDPGRFRQVLLNLISNAIKFTKKGAVTMTISPVHETVGTATVRVEVKDTGMGIDSRTQQRLFQPFQQADSSTTRRFGGTGLGLAICQKLVECMGGTIHIESQVGQGSTFWFTAQFLKQSRQAPILQNRMLEGIRLCCIDDHPVNRQLLEEYAKDWGMQVTTAATPLQALHLIQEAQEGGTPFQVAIVDMHMPVMNGVTFARTIKANPQFADLRLILLSSLGQRGDAKEAKEAGFSGYLTKPLRQSLLKHTLEAVMGLEPGTLHHPETPVITRFSALESQKTSSPRVLVVDDHHVNQQLAMMMIERLGYKVDVVANGQEAVEACASIPYGLVFMDCQMPIMDGYDATKKIREAENKNRQALGVRSEGQESGISDTPDASPFTPHGLPHVPIVAMTANAMPEDREKCLQAGMDDYLAKPIRPESIAEIFAKWLSAHCAK
ncbi:MAG: response regulator [Nitrospirota bacterium]|nr:response regulator [Nitrospirota bacterium]